MNSIFIDMPWTDYPANGILVTSDQVKELFNIITKAFFYKYNYETLIEQGNEEEAQKYNIGSDRIFNSFIDLIVDRLLDPCARDYALGTIRNIRRNNFQKKQVRTSYETIYNMLEPGTKNFDDLRNILADSKKIIDFYYFFDKCNTTAITNKDSDIKEIITTRNIISKMSISEIRNLE